MRGCFGWSALLLAGALAACSREVEWTAASSPERHGFDRTVLVSFAERMVERNSDSLLIARDGEIVLEWYRDESPRKLRSLASMPKAVVAALLLIAAAENGYVRLDDEVWRHVPSWKEDPMRSRVTLRELATHRSGLDNVFYPPGADLSRVEPWRRDYQIDPSSRFELALRRTPFVHAPGERYRYSNNGYDVLSYALSRSLARNGTPDLRRFYEQRVTERIGIPRAAWTIGYGESYERDGMHLYVIGSGARFTTRAVARIGELIRNRGRWEGEPIFDERWVEELWRTAPTTGSRELGVDHPQAGIGWFVNRDGFFPSLPRDAVVAAGGGHRILLVVPSLALVAVRTGASFSEPYSSNSAPSYWREIEEGFFAPLLASLDRMILLQPRKNPA